MPGMKRSLDEVAIPAQSQTKKQKVTRSLHHLQAVDIPEYNSATLDYSLQNKGFFDQQLERAIAVSCRAVGFNGTTPEAMEMFRGMVHGFISNFTGQVRNSMNSGRRTTPIPHDWAHALAETGMAGSSTAQKLIHRGEIPPSFLLPKFAPPLPPSPPPPNLEDLLGPSLSGKGEKDSKKYIPSHLPNFPSKHTWQATPVFTSRENDPRKIRERAAEEGIVAEQSLRKLMAAQKAGLQGDKARKQRRSKRMKKSDTLWQAAMNDMLAEEDEWAEKARLQSQSRPTFDDDDMDDMTWTQTTNTHLKLRTERKKVNLQEGVHVNYNQKFWRKSAQGF